MGQTWEGESHSINMGHTYKSCRTWKYESQPAKWVKFGQMGQTWEGESHSIKWVTLIKIVALGSKSHTAQNESHLAKWVKLGKVSHTL